MEQLDYYFPEGSRILEIPHIFTSVSLVKSKMAGFRFPKFRAKTLHPVSRIFPVKKKRYSAVLKSNALEINWSILFFAG